MFPLVMLHSCEPIKVMAHLYALLLGFPHPSKNYWVHFHKVCCPSTRHYIKNVGNPKLLSSIPRSSEQGEQTHVDKSLNYYEVYLCVHVCTCMCEERHVSSVRRKCVALVTVAGEIMKNLKCEQTLKSPSVTLMTVSSDSFAALQIYPSEQF
jgi:hypothetical protein